MAPSLIRNISLRDFLRATGLAILLFVAACTRSDQSSNFIAAHVDRQIIGPSKFPTATNPGRVGTYPLETKSGAGYFYDDVLEYRVWLHPENGAKPLNGTNDYFAAFAQYEVAEDFSKKSPGAEAALVLVRQREWIDEPTRGHFTPRKGDRITEWQVAWLRGSKRSDTSISDFLKHPFKAD